MAPLRIDDDLSRTAATEAAPLDVSAALAFVTTLPSPRTFRTQAYVPRHSFSILSGRPVSHMPALPEKKRRGGIGARLDAFRLGVEQQIHGLQQTAAETLQNVQNAAKEVFVDLGLIEKEGAEEETEAEWYEDEAFNVRRLQLRGLTFQSYRTDAVAVVSFRYAVCGHVNGMKLLCNLMDTRWSQACMQSVKPTSC